MLRAYPMCESRRQTGPRERWEIYSVELYNRVRRACHVEGMSEREAGRKFGIDRKTVSKILKHSVPPGYQRKVPPQRPKLDSIALRRSVLALCQ